MQIGLKNECQVMAVDALSAKAMGSGSLMVYATPAMVALMEQTAAESVEPFLGEGKTSVGTKIEVQHLAATPMGRFGESNELEGGLLFLLNNEAASFITGVVLPIDGGFSAYSGV